MQLDGFMIYDVRIMIYDFFAHSLRLVDNR